MIDLSQFTPTKQEQYESTCYAYAVGYTALSTKYNSSKNITNRQKIDSTAFSDGFIASMVRFKQKKFLRLRNVKCGLYGTADKALQVLVEFGCTQSQEFDCDCQVGVSPEVLLKALPFKIKEYKLITENFEFSKNSIQKIKNQLDNSDPVITAIHQTDELYDLSKGEAELKDLNADNEEANHVVCILGYDNSLFNGEGGFLIKNNYLVWGNKGFCWIRCLDFMHLIDTSYIMVF